MSSFAIASPAVQALNILLDKRGQLFAEWRQSHWKDHRARAGWLRLNRTISYVQNPQKTVLVISLRRGQ